MQLNLRSILNLHSSSPLASSFSISYISTNIHHSLSSSISRNIPCFFQLPFQFSHSTFHSLFSFYPDSQSAPRHTSLPLPSDVRSPSLIPLLLPSSSPQFPPNLQRLLTLPSSPWTPTHNLTTLQFLTSYATFVFLVLSSRPPPPRSPLLNIYIQVPPHRSSILPHHPTHIHLHSLPMCSRLIPHRTLYHSRPSV